LFLKPLKKLLNLKLWLKNLLHSYSF
jgi:hypothetical protein